MPKPSAETSPAATIRAEIECWWSGSSEHEIDQITDSIIKGLAIAGYAIVPIDPAMIAEYTAGGGNAR